MWLLKNNKTKLLFIISLTGWFDLVSTWKATGRQQEIKTEKTVKEFEMGIRRSFGILSNASFGIIPAFHGFREILPLCKL